MAVPSARSEHPAAGLAPRGEHGRLDVLVNDIFGGDRYMQWDKPLWEHDWQGGLRMLRMGVQPRSLRFS